MHFFDWVAQPGAPMGLSERLLATPFISVLWNGGFQVFVFFVLSGYVLTLPFVTSGDVQSLRDRAGRRYLRLGIPIFASVCIAYVVMTTSGYAAEQTIQATKSVWLATQLTPNPTFLGAMKQGLYEILLLGNTSYNPILWTMHVEFFGSLLIIAYRLLAWRGHAAWVSAMLYVVLVVAIAPMEWPAYIAFLVGSHMASFTNPQSRTSNWLVAFAGLAAGGIDLTMKLGFIEGLPLFAANRDAIIHLIGGALLVYGVKGGVGQSFLLSRPIQFLGRTSYSFYLLHLIFILSMSCALFNWATAMGLSRAVSVLASLAVTLPSLFLAAWTFERWIDRPTIRFCRMLGSHRLSTSET